MEDKTAIPNIEALLVKEGSVSSDEIAEARKIRETKVEQSKKPLGLIFLDQKKLTQEQLMRLLSLPVIQEKVGKRAVERQMISRNQLEECKEQAKQKDSTLSRVLSDKEYLTDTDRKKLIYEQLDGLTLAKQAIKYKLIQEADLDSALKLKHFQKSVCEILYDQNRVTLSELNHAFRKFSRDLKLGQILLQQEMISEADLEKALELQATAQKSLGQILLEKKWVALDRLYFALSIQYNTPFQKLDGYISYKKQKVELRNIVGQRYANENRIIPLFWSGDNLTLAVSNPANIWGMHELKSLHPGLQMNCVLITHEKFEQLYALLYGEVLPQPANYSNPQPGQPNPDGTMVVIDNPKDQHPQIISLYRTYKTLRQNTGVTTSLHQEETWFTEFIEKNFQTICTTYNCTGVQFRCSIKEGKAELFASPVP
ncbi:MAG: hypothetical protein MI892_22670 [Desulfobacterales bacterium]|nr:hypothetical protein [Desulfobacterales bacterium]